MQRECLAVIRSQAKQLEEMRALSDQRKMYMDPAAVQRLIEAHEALLKEEIECRKSVTEFRLGLISLKS